jgi:hypothetical protein
VFEEPLYTVTVKEDLSNLQENPDDATTLILATNIKATDADLSDEFGTASLR